MGADAQLTDHHLVKLALYWLIGVGIVVDIVGIKYRKAAHLLLYLEYLIIMFRFCLPSEVISSYAAQTVYLAIPVLLYACLVHASIAMAVASTIIGFCVMDPRKQELEGNDIVRISVSVLAIVVLASIRWLFLRYLVLLQV